MPGGLYCCVYGCGNNTKSHKGKSYFTLPTDPEKLALWLSLIRREDLLEKSKSGKLNQRICSDHFSEENIAKYRYIKNLNKDAVPNLRLPNFAFHYSQEEPEASPSSFEIDTMNTGNRKENSSQTITCESMESSSQTNEDEEQNINEVSINFNKSQCTAIVLTSRSLLLTPSKRKLITDIGLAKKKIKLLEKRNRNGITISWKTNNITSADAAQTNLLHNIVPTNNLLEKGILHDQVSEQEAQPGPSTALSANTRTSLDSNAYREQDPLSRAIEQCRFCGEFSKDCVAMSDGMPYLAANKTTLVLNDTSVQLDFNNQSLPNTVCRDCDAKLQEFADFIKVVKAAQDTLINVAEERDVGETRIEFEDVRPEVAAETETLVIKTEYDSQHEESDDEKEDKEGIVDSLTVGETIFLKKPVTHKRKSDTVTAKPKKLKAKKSDSEIIIDIKEEVTEKEDEQLQSGVSDSDVKPSELELATSALVFEMAGEGTSEYQVYHSDR